MQGQRRNKDEEMAGKLRDLQSIYAAVVLAGFGLGRPLDIAGQSDKLVDVFSIGFAVRCLQECWVCCRPT
jgi:hypothetical protein